MKKYVFIIAGILLIALLGGCGQPADEDSRNLPSGNSAGFSGSGLVVPMGSGYMDEKETQIPEVEAPKYKTIGTVSQDPAVKRTLLLNLTGKDIIGFSIKTSSEASFTSKLLLEGDVFVLDEIREIYYDPSPVKVPETQTSTETQAQTPSAGETETTTAAVQQAETQTAVTTEDQQFDVQITFSDWTTYVIHDLPFDDMKLGRLLLQNDILFLEYTSEKTGEEVITRQTEYNIKAAEWQAYQEQLAAQQAWQQQQQQYVTPATNNDAGCVGDAGLMW